ncbi:hypothetical protein HII30_18055 [Paenibacillus lemnae]|uniref:Uncharacterized protein n=2 Tax=Paenibacillus lemnae TaxID=1330551 RepID=A0A848MBZ8_PAELE|nr:hypothetical protein [Paenibacillus lemnae]
MPGWLNGYEAVHDHEHPIADVLDASSGAEQDTSIINDEIITIHMYFFKFISPFA